LLQTEPSDFSNHNVMMSYTLPVQRQKYIDIKIRQKLKISMPWLWSL